MNLGEGPGVAPERIVRKCRVGRDGRGFAFGLLGFIALGLIGLRAGPRCAQSPRQPECRLRG